MSETVRLLIKVDMRKFLPEGSRVKVGKKTFEFTFIYEKIPDDFCKICRILDHKQQKCSDEAGPSGTKLIEGPSSTESSESGNGNEQMGNDEVIPVEPTEGEESSAKRDRKGKKKVVAKRKHSHLSTLFETSCSQARKGIVIHEGGENKKPAKLTKKKKKEILSTDPAEVKTPVSTYLNLERFGSVGDVIADLINRNITVLQLLIEGRTVSTSQPMRTMGEPSNTRAARTEGRHSPTTPLEVNSHHDLDYLLIKYLHVYMFASNCRMVNLFYCFDYGNCLFMNYVARPVVTCWTSIHKKDNHPN